MIKVIASDMDGTLVSDQGILAQTAQTIRNAQKNGIKFLVSTGRVYEDAIDQLNDVNLKCDVLCMNGAELRDPEGKIQYQLELEQSVVKNVLAILEKNNLYAEFYTSEGIYSTSSEEVILDAVKSKLQFFLPSLTDKEALKQVRRHKEYTKLKRIDPESLYTKNLKIFKILSFSSDIKLIETLRADLNNDKSFSISGSFPINLEITHPKANKGLAVSEYADRNFTSKDQVMVLGDSFNDFSMFTQGFGFPIAMENAIDELKEISYDVTDNNNQDGVGKAIRKYVLKGE